MGVMYTDSGHVLIHSGEEFLTLSNRKLQMQLSVVDKSILQPSVVTCNTLRWLSLTLDVSQE